MEETQYEAGEMTAEGLQARDSITATEVRKRLTPYFSYGGRGGGKSWMQKLALMTDQDRRDLLEGKFAQFPTSEEMRTAYIKAQAMLGVKRRDEAIRLDILNKAAASGRPAREIFCEVHGSDVAARLDAHYAQLGSKFCWSCIRPLKDCAGSDCVGAAVERITHMTGVACATSDDDWDADSSADLSHEEKVIAAKRAIAAYARDKKLPSAEDLALFRELDEGRKTPKMQLGAGGLNFADGPVIEVEGNNHRLSSEALGRAADQLRASQSGRSYADLVSTREQRLTEVIDR